MPRMVPKGAQPTWIAYFGLFKTHQSAKYRAEMLQHIGMSMSYQHNLVVVETKVRKTRKGNYAIHAKVYQTGSSWED